MKLSYLCAVIEKFCTIASLQQKCLAQGNVGQLLTEAVNLNQIAEKMHVENIHYFAWEKTGERGKQEGMIARRSTG
jgi:hypothetical protein